MPNRHICHYRNNSTAKHVICGQKSSHWARRLGRQMIMIPVEVAKFLVKIWYMHKSSWFIGPWAFCQIRKIEGCACAGMPGTFSLPPRVSDPDTHHGTCVTHALCCMPGHQLAVSLEVGDGENVPGIPGACATRNFTYLVKGPIGEVNAIFKTEFFYSCYGLMQRATC